MSQKNAKMWRRSQLVVDITGAWACSECGHARIP